MTIYRVQRIKGEYIDWVEDYRDWTVTEWATEEEAEAVAEWYNNNYNDDYDAWYDVVEKEA